MKLFKSELLKLKNTSIFTLALCIPTLSILIGIKFFGVIKKNAPNLTPWEGLYSGSATFFIGILLPMFIIYATVTMGKIENTNNCWKQVLCMPIKKIDLYITKYLVLISLLVICLVSYLVQYGVVAYTLGATGFIPKDIFINTTYVFLAAQPFIALLFFLSNRFNSISIPLVIGMLFTLSSLMIVQSKYWIYAPWTYAMGICAEGLNFTKEIFPLLTVSLVLFLIIFSFDIISFNKKDII
ncbi:hypothetical protein SAMN02745163_01809 [Clostridium cavendishii DSM 21758]|uniref:ABC-2 type transport system permease protein n=1 Tax=Clostridium cavendishii DSM 21758 TaxID=1121302 RepID=A0A1M6IT02_9CLOT|nr:ABC transporter permease [Clostridium cavendishii]SHJ37603.1 hypothetical protein SAMN02745163_01809 [Clostridium cavendishii DSM 21758]